MSEEPSSGELRAWTIAEADVGARLDAYLSDQLTRYSRVYLRRLIQQGHITVGGKRVKAAYRLREGDQIEAELVEPPREGPEPEPIPLEILYEDEHLAAIDKPAGMVVHPAKGHWQGTLASALAHHFQQLSSVGGPSRPGIVHRLDRDTSGVIVVAKTDSAHHQLAGQFERREVTKEYFALVVGNPDRDRGEIREPIGPHPYQREKMAIRRDIDTARDAHTFYEVIERYKNFAAVRVLPKTGRTHQIRLHLSHLGHPVLCDRLYGGRARIARAEISGREVASPSSKPILERQALHARQLTLQHPVTGESLCLTAEIAEDLQATVEFLRSSAST
ncbi:MAG: RluA family pseudouridine synthase [Planctomycetota bacterium]|nr:MAG: RluA family pseudouridine synthase [Planctomycetota bacterium]REJ91105.1 MAG: RluA family pseudouridine synthase [Planctomycetota bacterium]REK27647.1 MAG: RluA family pseudouridine synthase [Planctomycetota bacterium]REK38510.1 MAG: RluA family pseudouridine synthase [Planctomycetota bacterium]